jgi:hypothetical protein
MKLRVVGAKLSWLPDGARVSGGMARIPVPRARSLGEALKISRASVMKLIPQTALNQLPLAGKLGGPITGMALTLGPQAIADAKATGLWSDPTSSSNWEQFGYASAKSQSANLVGMGIGLGAGAAVVALGITAAPAIILIGMAAGAAGQAGFNAWGLDRKVEESVRWLFQ